MMSGPVMLSAIAIGWLLATSQGGDPDSFTPPDAEARRAAIGETRYLPDIEKRTFAESPVFQAKTAPGEMDWLANHEDPGQTFDQFLKIRRNQFQKPRQVLYIQPLGVFPPEESDLLKKVAEFAAIFFQTEVKTQGVIDPDLGKIHITRRQHPGPDDLQFLSTDVLRLLKVDLPGDAYARLAVTMTDLYPEESWNFVFGSNNLPESDAGPLFLCPVCLRKLHAANAFDPVDRYQKMETFFREAKLEDEQEWVTRRLSELR